MNRRELIGTLGLGAAALAVNEGVARAQHQDHDHAHDAHMQHVQKIVHCQLVCNATAHHCLEAIGNKEGEVKDHVKIHSLAMDCQAFCSLASTLMVRGSELALYAHQACADACADCAKACEASPHAPIVKECAKACRECEEACRGMIKAMKEHKHA